MNDMPHAIHSKAIERACNLDRAWFAANPDCFFLLRDTLPMEFNGQLEKLPEGLVWRTLVAGCGEAPLRIRLPISMTAFPPCDAYSQDDLARTFQTFAPERLHKMLDFIIQEAQA